MLISRCYLEITNVCNLDCVFCPKTRRTKRMLTREEFEALTDKLQGKIQFLYFHLMGEPCLHPLLPEFILRAREKGFVPVLTTNGTRWQQAEAILQARPYKIQISLHSAEGNLIETARNERLQTVNENLAADNADAAGNSAMAQEQLNHYLQAVMTFALKAAQEGIIVILRLWNQGGHEKHNEFILNELGKYCSRAKWNERADGWKLTEHLYLEYDKMFEWPELHQKQEQEAAAMEESMFCHALRNQIGILADGSVVPCCLDHEGDLTLGNLFESSLEEILSSPRAKAIYEGFSQHRAVEKLCQTCEYAAIAKHFRKKQGPISL